MPQWKVHTTKIPIPALALHTQHGGLFPHDHTQDFEVVEADKADIDLDGSLVFTTRGVKSNEEGSVSVREDELVRAFAQGIWLDVKRMEEGE
jgi:hypothetical protein